MLSCLSNDPTVAAEKAKAGAFGFSGMEIYKVDDGLSRLMCADVNGDKLTDIAVVNNRRATIDFFIQKTPQEIASSAATPLEYDNINEIASDSRFRKESFLTEKRVFDLLLEDLNGDGRIDLAYCGDPKELVYITRTDSGWSEARQRFPLEQIRSSSRSLAAADLTGDGKTDLVLLGNDKTYVFRQLPDGKLSDPIELPNSDKKISGLETADLNGDGRQDLLLTGPGLQEPFLVRFQGASGLGPEVGIETPSFRSHLVADLTGDRTPEVSVVQDATGRLVVFRLETVPPDAATGLSKPRIFPLSLAAESVDPVVLADIDGDRRVDVLELVPKSAQLRLYRQGATGELLSSVPFPTLAGLSSVTVGDLDGDGKAEVITLSGEEKAIGVTRWDGARLPFPKSVPIEGKPLGCDLAALEAGKPEKHLAVAMELKGKTGVRLFAAGDPLAALPGEVLEIEGAKDPAERISFFDADQDGAMDLFVFFPYEPLRIYLRSSGDDKPGPRFSDVTGGKDFGRGLLQGAVTSSFAGGDIDGDGKPEFLLSKKNFARAFRVNASKVLEVVDQFNSRDPSSVIVGVAAGDWDGNGQVDVALLDKATSRLWFLARKAGGPFDITHEMKMPPFGYRRLAIDDLNGDGKRDLFVVGDDRFGVLYSGGIDYRFARLEQYETELKDAWLDLFEAGDLNSDGRPEVLVSELSFNLFEILVLTPGAEAMERGSRFKIYEDSSRRGESGDRRRSRQPREFVLSDVTADSKVDVVMLIHDRLIIYPQE